jgi:AAA15 family ATPase/GTPase
MTAQLSEFRIESLFGLYNYTFPFNSKERITIIIGPNGRGKTVCLKLIEALFRKRFSYIADIPFRFAHFSFSSGEQIKVVRSESAEPSQNPSPARISFVFSSSERHEFHWAPPSMDVGLRREIQRYLSDDWEWVSDDLWVDQRDGEELSTTEIVERYHLPTKLVSKVRQDYPEPFDKLIDQIDCHLIETQRLLVLPSDVAGGEPGYRNFGQMRRRARGSSLAIRQKAQKLQAILKDTLTHYANLSQSLDRSFPLRVFEAQGTATMSQDQLREELKRLDERRKALMSAGILDTNYEAVTLRRGNIDSGVAMALQIYVNDAVRKLDVFNNLRDRLDLLKEIIERRFIDKTFHIDRENGFRVISKTGIDIPLEKLSSGEQHQLILVFDLLFEVRENSLILIDEPELSLHVTWQKTFIESLRRIIVLNSFDVLLATHSPAVLARHFGLSVELGPVDE